MGYIVALYNCLKILVSFAGVIGNVINIIVLIQNRAISSFTETFTQLLIALSAFDLLYLLSVIGIFGLPALSPWYTENVFSKILPSW